MAELKVEQLKSPEFIQSLNDLYQLPMPAPTAAKVVSLVQVVRRALEPRASEEQAESSDAPTVSLPEFSIREFSGCYLKPATLEALSGVVHSDR